MATTMNKGAVSATQNSPSIQQEQNNVQQKRKRPRSKASKKQEKKKRKLAEHINDRSEGTHEEVLAIDVNELRDRLGIARLSHLNGDSNVNTANPDSAPRIEKFAELDGIEIRELSSTGDGLGTHADHPSAIFTVPFTVPGDVVRAKFIREEHATGTMTTDFVAVQNASADRQDSLVKCKYFSTCSGCQFQMLSYEDQLKHKRRVVDHAYRNFSGLPQSVVPVVGQTIASPLQYGYRTKLTPHFDLPSKKSILADGKPEVPHIGFMKKGTRHTIDIEDCPIATPALQLGLTRERQRVARDIANYRRGATVLLRESTERLGSYDASETASPHGTNGSGQDKEAADRDVVAVYEKNGDLTYKKTCISSNTAVTTEYVDGFVFKNSANAFFQNNNSILPRFTQYIRDNILPKEGGRYSGPKITNLIDAYSGSGLFTVTLSSLFERSIGIDISVESINFAKMNAKLNNLDLIEQDIKSPSSPGSRRSASRSISRSPSRSPSPTSDTLTSDQQLKEGRHVSFIAATASKLFSSAAHLDSRATAVVIDPPRKGCDEDFLRQLLEFGPQRIVYVSCNVHTQARDIGWILRNGEQKSTNASASEALVAAGEYEMESLTGFDFFPQTSHVESVAVLQRKPSTS